MEYLQGATPQDAISYMSSVLGSRSPAQATMAQRSAMDPAGLPLQDQVFNQALAQYAGVALTGEEVTGAREANRFNLETFEPRKELIGAQADLAKAKATVAGQTTESEVLLAESQAALTTAQAAGQNIANDFNELTNPEQLQLLKDTVAQSKITTGLFQDISDEELANLSSRTQLNLAQALHYGDLNETITTIFSDPYKYAGLIQDGEQLVSNYIDNLIAMNNSLIQTREHLKPAGREMVDDQLLKNDIMMGWLSNDSAMMAATVETMAKDFTNGDQDRLLRKLGLTNADEFQQWKDEVFAMRSRADLVGRTQTAVGGGAASSAGMQVTTQDLAAILAFLQGVPLESVQGQAAGGQ